MSTSINVGVDRGGLLRRNRQQTTANRQSELERSGTAQAAATAAEQREQRLAALGVTATGAPAGSSVASLLQAKAKPAAYRSDVTYPFLLLCNNNARRDDNFSLVLIRQADDQEFALNGAVDLSDDDELAAYLWLPSGISLAKFLGSATALSIKEELLPGLQASSFKGVYVLGSADTALRPKRGEEFKLILNSVANNDNGNEGVLVHGINKPGTNTEWVDAEYRGYSGDDIALDLVWAESSTASGQIYFGPRHAPVVDTDPSSGFTIKYFFINTPGGGGNTSPSSATGLLEDSHYLRVDEFSFSYGEYGTSIFEQGTGPGDANAMRLETGGSFFSGGVGLNAYVYDTYLDSPKDPPSLSNGPRTFECFVRVAGTNIGFEMWADCLYVTINASGVDVSELRFADVSTADSYLLPLTTANFSSWTHIAITVNDNEASLFVGGALIGRYTPANSSFNLNNKQLGIHQFYVRTYAATIVARLWVSSARVVPELLYTDTFTPPTELQ